ncbi:NAD(P)/FAD-dependent oxidoreductase [Nocardia sp. SYP-A9097]|uniref:NAD(P)/FAD-dependent oxidoreductase n=1 Tax=Nocardia sp. SYP-A9097 TaxID=2663237 RepID=UPI0013245DCB|nr:FAD-dependent oxidoreductase [Nocardia sp. SYP-A9097]MRH89317.1 NAD(P)/FAD-dependent oxidoreductase [Nocardia sp. SYP-A9097]
MTTARIVIVGGGFAGVECARYLERRLRPGEASIRLVGSVGAGQLYVPLLPQVASGVLPSQAVAVSLRRVLHRTELMPGTVVGADAARGQCVVRRPSGAEYVLGYDHLVLASGSITRILDIPGLPEHGFGMKTLAEAVYLRDHVLRQLDMAAIADDPVEQRERLTFVTVGSGYAGTETAAVLAKLTQAAARQYFPRLDPSLVRWYLINRSERVMPELGERLGADAKKLMAQRGIEFISGASATEVTARSLTLTTGQVIPTRTVVWTAGVTSSPLADHLGAETDHGRIITDTELRVPSLHNVWACGDVAAVPDTTQPGKTCAPTAQHASRQGRAAGVNLLATLRGKPRKPYRHRDLGMVVDLGGWDALARPMGIGLRGAPAQLVTRGYHLLATRTFAARSRIALNWALHSVAGDDFVRLGISDGAPHTIGDFERTGDYLSAEQLAQVLGDPRCGLAR